MVFCELQEEMKWILQRRIKYNQFRMVFARQQGKLFFKLQSVSILTIRGQRHLFLFFLLVGLFKTKIDHYFGWTSLQTWVLASQINAKNWWHSPLLLALITVKSAILAVGQARLKRRVFVWKKDLKSLSIKIHTIRGLRRLWIEHTI